MGTTEAIPGTTEDTAVNVTEAGDSREPRRAARPDVFHRANADTDRNGGTYFPSAPDHHPPALARTHRIS